MCNPQRLGSIVVRQVVWCSPHGIVHNLKMVFKRIIFLNFLCHSFHNHLPQAFALNERFVALEVHKQNL